MIKDPFLIRPPIFISAYFYHFFSLADFFNSNIFFFFGLSFGWSIAARIASAPEAIALLDNNNCQ